MKSLQVREMLFSVRILFIIDIRARKIIIKSKKKITNPKTKPN